MAPYTNKYPVEPMQNKLDYRQNAEAYFKKHPEVDIIWLSIFHQTICVYPLYKIASESFRGGHLFYKNSRGTIFGLMAYNSPTAKGDRYGQVIGPCGLDFPNLKRLKAYIKKDIKDGI